MAADAAGNDLSAAKIVVTSAFRFAPYDATQKLTADLIAPTVADVKTGLDKIFSKGGFVGLITEDGAPQDSRDADDAIKFHQPGYSINGKASLTEQFTVAEDNGITRQMTIGTPDASGVYHVTDVIQDGKWFCYQETVFKNGTHRRRLGVVNLTGNEQGQDTAGKNTGDAWTIEWIQDDACDSGASKYLQSFVMPKASSGSHAADHQADDSESQPVTD